MNNIVTIGGGTGTYTVLSGLKKQSGWNNIAAIVAVTDSGGSTGRLRDEFGYLPVGDFRMALVALASEESENVLRDLFLHRFDKGSELAGHNFGNLFLVAMTDILGSEEKAIEYTSSVLRTRGDVIPVATDRLTLVAEYENSEVVRGEAAIDEPEEDHDATQHITKLWVEPESTRIDKHASQAMQAADCIVLGPGDLYTSTLACVVVPGVAETLQKTDAKLVYVTNLMTKYGQTNDFNVSDHVKELERYAGRKMDHVIINTTPLPDDILKKYHAQDEFPVEDDLDQDERVVRADLLATEEITKPSGDTLKRSFIRHDSDKLAAVIKKVCL